MIHIPFFSKAPEPGIDDVGLGQSTLTDFKWMMRFRAACKQKVTWSAPTREEQHAFDDVPELDKFGDFLVATAKVGNQYWYVVERIWNGWPDPPRFAFFALEPDQSVWAGADFHRWPRAWAHEGIDL